MTTENLLFDGCQFYHLLTEDSHSLMGFKQCGSMEGSFLLYKVNLLALNTVLHSLYYRSQTIEIKRKISALLPLIRVLPH